MEAKFEFQNTFRAIFRRRLLTVGKRLAPSLEQTVHLSTLWIVNRGLRMVAQEWHPTNDSPRMMAYVIRRFCRQKRTISKLCFATNLAKQY